MKLADLLTAGAAVTVLFADLHAYLDNMKAPWELLELRTNYYEAIITGMLEAVGVDTAKLRFVRGTEYQLSREYSLDVYRLSSMMSAHDAQRAGAEVVKQSDNPPMSGLLYPGLQALDEEYLKCDAQIGGADQRKIFIFAEKFLPMLGYKKRIHLMNKMVPGLGGTKMSSSDPNSKIDILDDPKTVSKKIKAAFCEEGNVDDNGVLTFLRMVLYPLRELRGETEFVINRPEKYGGAIRFNAYDEVHEAFKNKTLFPADLKLGVTDAINDLLEPVRKKFEDPKLQKLTDDAYPEEKKKNKGNVDKAKLDRPVDVTRVAMATGLVLEVGPHPNADSLYVAKVDVGEDAPRDVVAGLVKYMSADELTGKAVVVCTNMKPAKVRGAPSSAMILAASSGEGDELKVELLQPPAGSAPGTPITFEGISSADLPADDVMNPRRKIFETVSADFTTSADLVATYKGVPFATPLGNVTVASLVNAAIK